MSALRRLNVQLRGTGDRAMVFAHGFGCDQRMWRHVAPRFESEFATVLFDHVGSGLSDPFAYSADKYTTLRAYAEDLIELGREVPLEDAVFVGHSCGAMIGLLAALEAPRMFQSLVLVSASPCYVDDADYKGGFTDTEVSELLRGLRSDYTGWASRMAPVFMGNSHRPELSRELLDSFKRSDPKVMAEFGAAVFTSDYRSELSKVKAECLIVQCKNDPVIPIAVGEYLCAHVNGSRLETIDSEGHFPHLSEPDRLVERIRQFVTSAPPNAADTKLRHGEKSRPQWPGDHASELHSSSGIWSQRSVPVSDADGRAELEELLLKRVGELSAHLGRFDMYALSISQWLDKGAKKHAAADMSNVRTRGAFIRSSLIRNQETRGIISQFDAINTELLAVLHRQEIAAKNCAVVPAFGLSVGTPMPANPREWYEYDSASDQELLFFIDINEREILVIASLYVRLCEFARLLTLS